jgi:hypothetical protein
MESQRLVGEWLQFSFISWFIKHGAAYEARRQTRGDVVNCYKPLRRTVMLDSSRAASPCLAAKSTSSPSTKLSTLFSKKAIIKS